MKKNNNNIFSSKSPCLRGSNSFQEWKVVLMVMVVVLAAELGFRATQARFSKNLANIMAIPEAAKQLNDPDKTSILLLGNSYTRRDVHMDVLRSVLKEAKVGPFIAEKVYPDATAVIDWHYLFRTYFVDKKQVPDVVVIGFTARNHLSDERGINIPFLSGRFCRLRHTPEIFREDVHTFEKRVQFCLARVLAMISNQEHIRQRALNLVIPRYRYGTRKVNDILTQTENNTHPDDPSHMRLSRFVRMLEQSGAKVIFVAMPSPDKPPLDPDMLKLLKQGGIELMDLRHVEGIEKHHFVERFYLNEEGGKIYTRIFAEKLAREVLE